MKEQFSIVNESKISGVGLHTGNEVSLTFKPAPINHGILFKRIDLDGHPELEANIDYVTNTERSTTIEKGDVKIQTVEHVLAAIVGIGIDNLIIEINNDEPPILDGSSIEFIKCLKKGGVQAQKSAKKKFIITEEIRYDDPISGASIKIIPAEKFSISVSVNYKNSVVLKQKAELNSLELFEKEFANARTFCFLDELEHLLNNQLIKGGNLSNAIVYVNKDVEENELARLAKIFNQKSIKNTNKGHLNNIDLRYKNEAARHKVLDMLGDLSLIGVSLQGKIIAHKPGHTINKKFAKLIKEKIKTLTKMPPTQLNSKNITIMNIEQIMELLPHRPPFLLVDKILNLCDNRVVGLKNVSMNEPFFNGHFPGSPVMPGVLQIEAMAQVGGILVLSSVPDPKNYLTYFMKIDKVKFKHKVVPGDTLIFELNLISPIRRGICHMYGKAYVGDKLVMEGEMMAKIVKKSAIEN